MGNPFKKTNTTTETNEYQHFQTPGWAELDALKAWKPQDDPSIPFNYANQRNDLERSFVAPTGSYQTPELREQQMRSGIQEIGQNEAQARRADQYGQNTLELDQLGTVAGLKAPKFAQTKGTTKGSSSGGWLTDLAGAAVGGLASGIGSSLKV